MLIIAADLPVVNSLAAVFPEVIMPADEDADYLAWLDAHADEMAEESELAALVETTFRPY